MLSNQIKSNVQELIDFLEHLPDKLFDFDSNKDPDLSCGTPACIAGWACYVADGKPKRRVFFDMETAANFLGVSYSNDWLLDAMFNNNREINDVTKQDAINMLKHYKETGECKWPEHIQCQLWEE